MLRELAAGELWVAEMPAGKMGFQFGARMTVVRLPSGELWVHSPVTLTPTLKQQLDALGPVAHVVAPFRFHFEHLPEFAAAYPRAQLYSPANFKRPPELVGRMAVLGEKPEPAWRGTLEQLPFAGSALYDEVDFFHQPTGTLIVTDLMFNICQKTSTTSTRIWSKIMGLAGGLCTPRSFSIFARDRQAIRESLRTIDSWDFDRIIVTHGEIVDRGGKPRFKQIFEKYL